MQTVAEVPMSSELVDAFFEDYDVMEAENKALLLEVRKNRTIAFWATGIALMVLRLSR